MLSPVLVPTVIPARASTRALRNFIHNVNLLINKSRPLNYDHFKGNKQGKIIKTNKIDAAKKNVADALNNVKDKQQALATAQKALSDLQNPVAQDETSGAAGFFKSIADNKDNSESLREDAQTAYNIVTGQPNAYQNITVEWAKKAVDLGQEKDSTSLNNIEKALGYYQHWMTYRDKYGLSHPSISLTAVAIAMLSSDFQHYSDEFNHPILLTAKYGPFYEDEEDISAGDVNPIDNWMSEKADIDNYIKDHPDAATYSFESNYPLTQDEWEKDVDFWNDKPVYIGHYTSMIKPDANYVGLAGNEYEIQPLMNNADSMDEIIFNPVNGMDFDSYQDLVHSYLQNFKQEDKIKTLNANVVTANQNLINAQNAVKSAQNNVQSLQANLAELNNGSTKINKAISDTQAALAKGQENLEFEQKQLDQANQTLADVQAKVGTKAKALDDAKAAQSKAVEALSQVQKALDETNDEVKAAQSNVETAQNNLNTKNNDLKNAQNKLTALNQTLSNLENSKANLEKAQKALDNANDEALQANKDVITQQSILSSLKKNKEKADAQVITAIEELKQAQSDLTVAKGRLVAEQKIAEQEAQKDNQPTSQPTAQPSEQPTAQPTEQPTSQPSEQPTSQPTAQPTEQPSEQPAIESNTQLPGEQKNEEPQPMTTKNGETSIVEPTNSSSTQPTTKQDAQQLPQTGNQKSSSLIGLGFASLLSALGLTKVNKKRKD